MLTSNEGRSVSVHAGCILRVYSNLITLCAFILQIIKNIFLLIIVNDLDSIDTLINQRKSEEN